MLWFFHSMILCALQRACAPDSHSRIQTLTMVTSVQRPSQLLTELLIYMTPLISAFCLEKGELTEPIKLLQSICRKYLGIKPCSNIELTMSFSKNKLTIKSMLRHTESLYFPNLVFSSFVSS